MASQGHGRFLSRSLSLSLSLSLFLCSHGSSLRAPERLLSATYYSPWGQGSTTTALLFPAFSKKRRSPLAAAKPPKHKSSHWRGPLQAYRARVLRRGHHNAAVAGPGTNGGNAALWSGPNGTKRSGAQPSNGSDPVPKTETHDGPVIIIILNVTFCLRERFCAIQFGSRGFVSCWAQPH